MNIQKIQKLVENLIDSKTRMPDDRRGALLSYYMRLLTSNFTEEFDRNTSLEVKLTKLAGKNKDRAMELASALKNRRYLSKKEEVIKTLLKISENNQEKNENSLFLGNFSTKQSIGYDMTNPSMVSANGRGISHFATKLGHSKLETSKNFEIEEGAFSQLFKSLISTFQAVHSEYFFYDKHLEMFVLKASCESEVSLSFMKIVQKLNEIGWLFQKIASAFDIHQKKISTLTMQGLICAIKNELNSFYGFLVQLEGLGKSAGNLSTSNFLTSLVILCEDQFKKLRVFAYILDMAANLTSSELLSLLFQIGRGGKTNQKQDYIRQIFQSTGRTFTEFVNAWINRGEILDPMGEFFIRANISSTESDKYWSDGLQFREDKIPSFMDRATARSIFTVGKIVRLLKKVNNSYNEKMNRLILDEIVFYNNDLSVFNKLNGIHITQNRILIDHLFGPQKLKIILGAFKSVYLGSRGDFLTNFIENLENEISLKNLPKAMKHQIYFCLEAAIRVCFKANSLKLKNLGVIFLDIKEQASSLTTEDTLNYFVNFSLVVDSLDIPINNVITAESLKSYQQILRYLLTFKIEQFELRKIWNLHSKHKLEKSVHMRGLIALSSNLRVKMLSFVDALLNFWSLEVIEKHWKILLDELDASNEFEQVIQAHNTFLQNITSEIVMERRKKENENYKSGFDGGKERDRPKSRYDLLLHQILELIYKYKNSQEIIFVALKPNLDNVDGDSFDSIDRIENHNLDRMIDLNENFIRQMYGMLKEIEQRLSRCIIELLDFYDNKNINNRFDFNEFYQTERKMTERQSFNPSMGNY
jgi:hypothetical protein